jgi:HSP20 family protein
VAWNPFQELLAFQERAARAVGVAHVATPPVALYETADGYVLTAEVPGMARDEINLTVRDNHLTIAGERPKTEGAPDHYHRIERGFGAFSRTFAFETPIDGDRITADLKDGVLTVILPKRTPPGPRKVAIESTARGTVGS